MQGPAHNTGRQGRLLGRMTACQDPTSRQGGVQRMQGLARTNIAPNTRPGPPSWQLNKIKLVSTALHPGPHLGAAPFVHTRQVPAHRCLPSHSASKTPPSSRGTAGSTVGVMLCVDGLCARRDIHTGAGGSAACLHRYEPEMMLSGCRRGGGGEISQETQEGRDLILG